MNAPPPLPVSIVLTTDQKDFMAVEVRVGKRVLCASTGHSVQEAYERTIRKLVDVGREMWQQLREGGR